MVTPGKMETEEKLRLLGYRKIKGNTWINGTRTVNVQHASKCKRDNFRIIWHEKWKDYHALIFDYSDTGGPICIVPANVLFKSNFITKKRAQDFYENSGNWWSQRFPMDHELATLILKYTNRWDLL